MIFKSSSKVTGGFRVAQLSIDEKKYTLFFAYPIV